MRDICENRHRGSQTSIDAHRGSDSERSRQRAWILKQAKEAGWHGVTVDELSARASSNLGREIPPNRISGRVSELKQFGDLVETNRRRKTRTGKTAAVHCVPEALRPVNQSHPTLF